MSPATSTQSFNPFAQYLNGPSQPPLFFQQSRNDHGSVSLFQSSAINPFLIQSPDTNPIAKPAQQQSPAQSEYRFFCDDSSIAPSSVNQSFVSQSSNAKRSLLHRLTVLQPGPVDHIVRCIIEQGMHAAGDIYHFRVNKGNRRPDARSTLGKQLNSRLTEIGYAQI